ncbi:MAG: dephospho-CoA kinase [Bacteroidales bacterium]|nr:dephospho-CoA kinase [Bacteroidales bacterium]
MPVIAITGGIGSGKSVVSRILAAMGYPVYDCDSRAKALMDADEAIKRRLIEEISETTVDADGVIHRRELSRIVFADALMLERLNAIVHAAVRADLLAWTESLGERLCFVETAILYQSGLNRIVDEEWEVTAPTDIRIARVMKRNSCTRAQVEARIASQAYDIPENEPRPRRTVVVNDGITPLLPRIVSLLGVG